MVEQARALGFDLCGVAPAEDFPELGRLPEWLSRGYAGEMDYLGDARRRSPARVLPLARSLIVCALNYNTSLPYSTQTPSWGEGVTTLEGKNETRKSKLENRLVGAGLSSRVQPRDAPPNSASSQPSYPAAPSGPRGWLSRYAWGDDYHEVLRGKLEALVAALREQVTEPFEARAYVDTGPVIERVAAKYAGLGWLAKNTCLINEELGSWLFLGVIVTTLELAPSLDKSEAPPPDLCGNCGLCIEACPTGAIVEPYVLDAPRCISYLTIELRGSIPAEFREAIGRHVFGCDICQDVCPWNRSAPATPLPAFQPRTVSGAVGAQHAAPLQTRSPSATPQADSLFAPELEWLASLSAEQFREVFRGSAVKRTKWRGLVRNACVALGNSNVRAGAPVWPRILAQLERLAQSDDAIIAEHARWALARLR